MTTTRTRKSKRVKNDQNKTNETESPKSQKTPRSPSVYLSAPPQFAQADPEEAVVYKRGVQSYWDPLVDAVLALEAGKALGLPIPEEFTDDPAAFKLRVGQVLTRRASKALTDADKRYSVSFDKDRTKVIIVVKEGARQPRKRKSDGVEAAANSEPEVAELQTSDNNDEEFDFDLEE